jgi:hypothetical protein
MKEKLKEITDTITSRGKSSLFGSITLSWLLINWNITLLLIFSTKPIEGKIEFISNTSQALTIWAPIISGSIIALVYPLISYAPWFVEYLTEKYKLKSLNTLIPEDKALKLHKLIDDKTAEITSITFSKNEDINKITTEINDRYLKEIETYEKIEMKLKNELEINLRSHRESLIKLEENLAFEHKEELENLNKLSEEKIRFLKSQFNEKQKNQIEKENTSHTVFLFLVSIFDSTSFHDEIFRQYFLRYFKDLTANKGIEEHEVEKLTKDTVTVIQYISNSMDTSTNPNHSTDILLAPKIKVSTIQEALFQKGIISNNKSKEHIELTHIGKILLSKSNFKNRTKNSLSIFKLLETF